MKSKEVKEELAMSYDELVKYLLKKYGAAKYDYFKDLPNNIKDKRVKRSKEGLLCHHIDEDKAIMLSTYAYAIISPPEYQKASRLVYCNILEHLILHIKIAEEVQPGSLRMPGVGGAVNYMCPQINDYYNGYEYKREYQRKMFSLIKNNYDDYINVLNYFLGLGKRSMYSYIVTKDRIASGWDGHIIGKIYAELD